MNILTLPVGPMQNNCYILYGNEGKAVMIDPGFRADAIMKLVNDHHLTVEYIMLTHAHFDHYYAAAKIIALTNAKLIVHKKDAQLLQTGGLGWLFASEKEVAKNRLAADILVDEGDTITCGGIVYSFLHTPGHTDGSMCILAGNSIFTGDTVLYSGPGRTDLEGGDELAMRRTYKEKLSKLNDGLIVYGGHGPKSTMEDEKRLNPYFHL